MKKHILKALLLTTLVSGSLKADEEYVSYGGDCYACSCNACLVAASIGIGILLFTGMIIVIGNDGTNSHSHN